MKKIVAALTVSILLTVIFTGCSNSNITIEGTVKEMSEHGFYIHTGDARLSDVSFVAYEKDDLKNFTVGQKVTIEALPEIQETYPVKITAVKVSAVKEH